MTRDVYVVPQTVPERGKKGEGWYHFDKVNLASTLFNQEYSHTEPPVSPLEKKCNSTFRHPVIYCECGETIWKTFHPDFWKALADSTMELIDSRCVGARRNTEVLFLFIPFFQMYTGIKQISAAPTWPES